MLVVAGCGVGNAWFEPQGLAIHSEGMSHFTRAFPRAVVEEATTAAAAGRPPPPPRWSLVLVVVVVVCDGDGPIQRRAANRTSAQPLVHSKQDTKGKDILQGIKKSHGHMASHTQ